MPPPAAGGSERYEDKSAPMELRVGQKQLSLHAIAAGMADNPAAKIKHIQIERSGFPVAQSPPPGAAFKALQQSQERGRPDGPVHANNHVQVIRLTVSESRGAINWRACENVETGFPKLDNCAIQRNRGLSPRTRNIRAKTNPDIIRSISQSVLLADDTSNFYDSAYTYVVSSALTFAVQRIDFATADDDLRANIGDGS